MDSSSSLQALIPIRSVGEQPPFRIVPITQVYGAIMSAEDMMAAKVKWIERAGYSVLTEQVPAEFRPYNAVIRVSERGTEDKDRDYLAHFVDDTA